MYENLKIVLLNYATAKEYTISDNQLLKLLNSKSREAFLATLDDCADWILVHQLPAALDNEKKQVTNKKGIQYFKTKWKRTNAYENRCIYTNNHAVAELLNYLFKKIKSSKLTLFKLTFIEWSLLISTIIVIIAFVKTN